MSDRSSPQTSEPDRPQPDRPLALVTGASSGIGRATAVALAAAGFDVVAAARRMDRLEALAEQIGSSARRLDVTEPESVESLAAEFERLDLLVNNAGGAFGLEPVAELDESHWRDMFELNVLAVARMVRAFLPALDRAESGQIVNVASTSSFEVYPGGGGYTAAKHALRALDRTLRLELLGSGIKITEICPALTETEFSLVRFEGDRERADAVYRGMTPLTPEDVARTIVFAATQPAHVSIDEIVVRPLDQADSTTIHRRSDDLE